MTLNDLRQWQHNPRVDANVRQITGDAADEIERLLRVVRLAHDWFTYTDADSVSRSDMAKKMQEHILLTEG